MPNFDGGGPRGAGPMTGRGLGLCGRGLRACGDRIPRGLVRGFRRGFARFCPRWGIGNSQQVALTKEQEKKVLEADLAELEAEKAEIEKSLKKLK